MRCPTVIELPPPPLDKTGWPWTEESPQLPDMMPNPSTGSGQVSPWPRVSIVTPSFNQTKFIEATIRSVLLQGYPDLEYIVIDGGSTDSSVNIIHKYEPWLAYWISEHDQGQSHAINKGFQQANGEIMAWLNSDDIYYPNALGFAASSLIRSNSDILIGAMDKVEIHQGHSKLVKHSSPHTGTSIHAFPIFSNGRIEDFQFMQPPMFWRRAIWQQTGEINERYLYIMDREWCLRALAHGARVLIDGTTLARFALHPGSKTLEHKSKFVIERVQMYRRLSHMPGFRTIPCLLDSLLAYLRFLQDNFYAQYDEFHQNGQRSKAFLTLFVARLLRRARLGMTGLAQFQRTLTMRRMR